ncbi:MAG: hypothetical protein ABIQ41_10850 [Gemmatimonadales bacterium]
MLPPLWEEGISGGEGYQDMMDVLHAASHVTNQHACKSREQQHHSKHYIKDINVLKKTNQVNRLSLKDVKTVIKLRRQIQRTGLTLAKHAEENALAKYQSSIGIRDRKPIARRKLIMYCIRINKAENLVESKPCSHCLEVLKNFGIRKIIYSTSNGTLVSESIARINSEPSVGYRAVETAIQILDAMMDEFNNSGVT